jgi:ubiquinone/menaquinone biosynthesis C-methylase UbiE
MNPFMGSFGGNFRRAERWCLRDRSEKTVGLFIDSIRRTESLLDIGCGTGHIAEYISKEKKMRPVLCDLIDRREAARKLRFYHVDGERLPFRDDAFDAALLCSVLHHAADPMGLMKEAVRVSRKKVFIVEDVYANPFEKAQMVFADSIINRDFGRAPHNNRNERAWEDAFARLRLRIISKRDATIRYLFLFYFPTTGYVLDVAGSKR